MSDVEQRVLSQSRTHASQFWHMQPQQRSVQLHKTIEYDLLSCLHPHTKIEKNRHTDLEIEGTPDNQYEQGQSNRMREGLVGLYIA